VFSLYLLSLRLISPLSKQHHLVVRAAAPLWCVVLIASEAPSLRGADIIGAGLFVLLHWLAVVRLNVLGFPALAALYGTLLWLGARLTAGPSRRPHVITGGSS
jgi:hypothetical protein